MTTEVARVADHGRPRAPRAPRRGGRGRGGRAVNENTSRPESASQTNPVSQIPAQHTDTAASRETQGSAETSRRRRPRGRRGGNGGNGGRAEQTEQPPTQRRTDTGGGDRRTPRNRGSAVVGGRKFGGQLTRHGATDEEGSVGEGGHQNHTEQDAGLRADAPEFVPGQTVAPPGGSDSTSKGKSKPTPSRSRPPKVTTKSTAEDITTRIHEDISHNLYECPICTNELGSKSRVWSCRLCWTVFHLSCIKKWSKNEGSAFRNDQQRQQDGEDETNTPRQWRCPGCNLPQDTLPTTYSCWCEKEVDPRSLPGLPPHSCGQTCSRPRSGCPHPCDSICHAGPCPPCTAMGPTLDCFCGKNSSTKRCVETDYVNGWSCGQICEDLLPCGEHTCPRPCHEGLCGDCEVKVQTKCYCGKVETEMLCSSKEEEIPSAQLSDDMSHTEEWIGSFRCGETCNRPFDCGVHFCQKDCHPQEATAAHCPRSADVITKCPCGKTPLAQIPGFSPRTSCEDPIPNCQEACGKLLPCGHPCPMICHTGACRPCLRMVKIQCRCGRSSFDSVCHQGSEEPPQCFRICKATMNCGRHTCAEHCCPGERKALERQATRRKLRSLNSTTRPDDDIEAEHICTRVCGRLLKCEKHTCPELCHKGSCNTCREAIFDEITCNCGRSVLYPPLPCGTKPPPCRFDCERPKACHHPQTPHNCHTDDESCPKCPYLTEKKCLCGKKDLKNQPCWLVDARCGLICGKPLKCGSHTCQKGCHRPGDCEDATEPCRQPCGKNKSLCGHACVEPCHAPYPCPEKTPCSTKVTVTCACGRLRQEKRCGAVKASISKGQVQQQQQAPALTPLKCDDECARLERNRSLASALKIDIDPSTTSANGPSPHITSSNLPYSAETLDMYIQLSSSSTLSTLQSYESTLHSLAVSTTQRSVRFQPAKAPLRAFAHSLAADWGFATESFDPEPHRHVFVLKPTSWTPPIFGFGNGSSMGIGGMSVGDCVKFRERERMKEREAQRAALAEAKALREGNAGSKASGADGGWAQVASRRKNGSDSTNAPAVVKTGGLPSFSGSFYAALSGDSTERSGNSGRLVLRSGVGASKNLRNKVEVADSWEEEVEKEEEEEKKEMGQARSETSGDGKDQSPQGPHNDGDTIDKSEKFGVESVTEKNES